jgi:hypothetical protein
LLPLCRDSGPEPAPPIVLSEVDGSRLGKFFQPDLTPVVSPRFDSSAIDPRGLGRLGICHWLLWSDMFASPWLVETIESCVFLNSANPRELDSVFFREGSTWSVSFFRLAFWHSVSLALIRRYLLYVPEDTIERSPLPFGSWCSFRIAIVSEG